MFIDFSVFLYVGNFHNKILRKKQVTIKEVVEIVCCLFNRNFKCKKDQVTKACKFACVCTCARTCVCVCVLLHAFYSYNGINGQQMFNSGRDVGKGEVIFHFCLSVFSG